MLEDRRQAYVLAVRSNYRLRFPEEDGLIQTDPATLAEEIDVEDWSWLSAGEGAKGPRLYEGARLPMDFSKNDDVERWVLFRKSLCDPKALAYSFVHAPKGTSPAEIAGAASLFTTSEIQHLFAKLSLNLQTSTAFVWLWSRWRRDHQAVAPISHRKRYKMQFCHNPLPSS